MHNLKLVMRKQSDKPKTEGQSTKTNLYSSKMSTCCKTKKGCDPGLDPGSENKLLYRTSLLHRTTGEFVCGLY